MTTRRGRSASLVPGNEDEVRMERVHELRQRIAAGNYAAPAEMLAARVIDAAMVMENDEAA